MEKRLDWRFTPFDIYGNLLGRAVTVDAADSSLFCEQDVAEITDVATSGNQFDGMAAAVMRLRDGRWVAYETSYESTTGNEFTDGKGIVYVAQARESVVSRFSDNARRLMDRAV